MKAVVAHAYGDEQSLTVETVPDLAPREGEVLVDVRACAINPFDLTLLKGLPTYPLAFPHVLGSDVAGTIAAIGPGVTPWRAGDAVVVNPVWSCGACAACEKGRDNLCETFTMPGAGPWGGFAQQMRVPARALFAKPASLTFEQAAALPVVSLTAWHLLEQSGVGKGDKVLVSGATGGVGSAAVQFARVRGAQVMATTASAAKMNALRALGADAVVNSAESAIAHMARAWTGKRGVDVVIETVGAANWTQTFGSLRPGGTLAICGSPTGPDVKVELAYLYSRELRVLGARLGTRLEFEAILSMAREGQYKPLVGRTFPLDQIGEAFSTLRRRAHIGKIVLIP